MDDDRQAKVIKEKIIEKLNFLNKEQLLKLLEYLSNIPEDS